MFQYKSGGGVMNAQQVNYPDYSSIFIIGTIYLLIVWYPIPGT